MQQLVYGTRVKVERDGVHMAALAVLTLDNVDNGSGRSRFAAYFLPWCHDYGIPNYLQVSMLIETDLGLLAQLTDLRTGWLHSLRAGLFQGDFQPRRYSTLADVEVCDFSGYSGLRDMITWDAPAIVGARAIMQHGYFLWRHNGGLVANAVQGYYVVDRAGVLVWAELRAEGSQLMQSMGDVYRCVPRYSLRSEFTGG